MKSNDDNPKPTQSKSTKKSTKSRSKSSKSETSTKPALVVNNTTICNNNSTNTNSYLLATPTTPTSSTPNLNNSFDAQTPTSSGGVSGGIFDNSSTGSRTHHKSYAGFEPRSIKVIWEQHDQSDLELSQDVCARLAEDASYKLWELVNNIKTYVRHSGGVITFDLVNEVLRDADVPPVLGAMDSAWDRIDYDGSYFFYSDKILELRDEYQKEINIEIPNGPDFVRSYLVDDKHLELLKKYVPSLIYITVHGENEAFETALQEMSFSPLIGKCYRVLLAKTIEILAYKQSDYISARCWRLLKACTVNTTVRELDCREEYFHLAEILVCQLIGPFESIKVHNVACNVKDEDKTETTKFDVKPGNTAEVKMEQTESPVKTELLFADQTQQQQQPQQQQLEGENIFHLQPEEDGTNDADLDLSSSSITTVGGTKTKQFSPYFASPVDMMHVNDLCSTLGLLSDMSGYFENECTYLITRRLERFFNGRKITTEREYNYIGRSLRGLIALGEYSFREFIPYLYKFEADDTPENIWNDIALSAVYLQGPDDIFLYEWLEYVCGGDKLQPFLCYYAEYHEKLLTARFLQRKQPTFKINPKVGVRRLEWSTIAAAMCHGDDPNKALKPKPTLKEMFPKLTKPNLRLNRAGTIRFKFAGCRPVILKPSTSNAKCTEDQSTNLGSIGNSAHHDILIAKRKLYKPLSNERRLVTLSSYFYLQI